LLLRQERINLSNLRCAGDLLQNPERRKEHALKGDEMRTIEIMRENIVGLYLVRIQANVFDTIKEISFDNLFDAIRYANHLTFSECEKMDSKANNDVPVYYVAILMKEDCFGNDCKIVIDGKETYPTIDYFCKVKPMF